MGGQIMTRKRKRKRKGRPPKSDLSRNGRSPAPESETTFRRSLRRRNMRYSNFIDYDDFEIDDEEEEELDVDEEELRRGRKVKLVVKLSQQRARGRHASESRDSGSGHEEEEDEDDGEDAGAVAGEVIEMRVVKKRKISGRDDDDEMDDQEEDDYGGHGKEVIAPSHESIQQFQRGGRWNLRVSIAGIPARHSL